MKWPLRIYCNVEYHGPIGRMVVALVVAFLGGVGLGRIL